MTILVIMYMIKCIRFISSRNSDAPMNESLHLYLIDSADGLSPGRRQAITWTNSRLLLFGSVGTEFNDMTIFIQETEFENFVCHWM